MDGWTPSVLHAQRLHAGSLTSMTQGMPTGVAVEAAQLDVLAPVIADAMRDAVGGLSDVLAAFTRGLMRRLPLESIALVLFGRGTLLVAGPANAPVWSWITQEAQEDIPLDEALECGQTEAALWVTAIRYGTQQTGWMQVQRSEGVASAEGDAALLEAFAHHCGRVARRFDVQHWCRQQFNRPVMLTGYSAQVRALEVFAELAAESDLPVLLTGEFGTETAQLAATIHFGGPAPERPFVHVNCGEPDGTPGEWFARARGGTLFLSDVDALPMALQTQLPRHLHSPLGQWLEASAATPVRVIASASRDLRALVAEGRFSRALLAELDFLSVRVPPLRERPDDIEAMVAAVLARTTPLGGTRLTPSLLAACRAYGWPENVFELERVLGRLGVLAGREPIGRAEIARYAPELLTSAPIASAPSQPVGPLPAAAGQDATVFAPAFGSAPALSAGAADAPPRPSAPAPVTQPAHGDSGAGLPAAQQQADHGADDGAERWMRHLMARDQAALAPLHPGLRKALLHIADSYCEPLEISALANRAHVSQSHLSFLFRHSLGTSCKGLVTRMRVERAKELLISNRRLPVTDIALSVGFADLSHFEKCFRRIVGASPRAYRRLREDHPPV
ncbi:MAG: helix-turn-helix domain-containing protein [Alphaproteobacteria bacterium]|nr:MAG: helix-turn-helix domain-containing protein [Alphaproteobacteria bacterium]